MIIFVCVLSWLIHWKPHCVILENTRNSCGNAFICWWHIFHSINEMRCVSTIFKTETKKKRYNAAFINAIISILIFYSWQNYYAWPSYTTMFLINLHEFVTRKTFETRGDWYDCGSACTYPAFGDLDDGFFLSVVSAYHNIRNTYNSHQVCTRCCICMYVCVSLMWCCWRLTLARKYMTLRSILEGKLSRNQCVCEYGSNEINSPMG